MLLLKSIAGKQILRSFIITLMWSLTATSVITPRIYLRIEYALGHGGTEPYMFPILDWPQYFVLCFSTLLMGILIEDFAMFILMYFIGVLLACLFMYVLICLPIYLNILSSEYLLHDGLSEVALNYIAKSWVIAPFVAFFFVGLIGVLTGDFLMERSPH